MFMTLIILQVVTIVYHQVTTLIDLYPFNGVYHYTMKQRQKEALINGIIMVIPIILTLTGNHILIAIGGGIWTLVTIGTILSWWLPYTTGIAIYKMPNNETWSQFHERVFSKTIIILPHINNNPRPNLEHMILHTFIFGSAILSFVYSFS